MTLLQTFLRQSEDRGDQVALRELQAGGAASDRDLTWEEWARRSRNFAGALRSAGCRRGDTVAILADNSFVWPVADLGCMMAGAVSVGIYPTSAPVQVHSILNDCAARVVVVDTIAQLEKVRSIQSAVPSLAVVISRDHSEVESFDAWTSAPPISDIAMPAMHEDALFIYTSGSTGDPKGARISHQYLAASAASIQQTLQLTAHDSALSLLPYCHAAERIFGLYTRIHSGMSAALVSDPARVWEAARAFEPTLFGGLPRFYEKLYERLRSEFGDVSATNRERVAARISELLGSRVRIATSGGASLSGEVWNYLKSAGMEVIGAYGLTEHLCATMHRPGEARAQSVGQAMPGTQIRISESGEILLRRSQLTFSGYHNKPAETRAAFADDGEWLRTGDRGQLDGDGFLYLTGREKELIALSTGKKIAPLPIESKLLDNPLISQAVLLGENQKYVSALIALRPMLVHAWGRSRGLSQTYDELIRHPEVYAEIAREVARVNQDLSRTEQIKRFVLLPRELTVEQEELTPTLKVRRAVVAERYRGLVDDLYSVNA